MTYHLTDRHLPIIQNHGTDSFAVSLIVDVGIMIVVHELYFHVSEVL
jgi:hypothetical protein